MPNPNGSLPPFAKPLLAKRAEGIAPINDLLITCGWKLGKDAAWWPWRIVAPDDVDPLTLDFTICRGLQCVVAGDDVERMCAVAANVLAFRPARLLALHVPSASFATLYDPPASE